MTELSDIVRKGNEFLLQGLGVQNVDLEILGKLTNLRNDARVKSVEMETVWLEESDMNYRFPIFVTLNKTLTLGAIDNLLKSYGLTTPAKTENGFDIIEDTLSYRYKGAKANYDVNITPVTDLELVGGKK